MLLLLLVLQLVDETDLDPCNDVNDGAALGWFDGGWGLNVGIVGSTDGGTDAGSEWGVGSGEGAGELGDPTDGTGGQSPPVGGPRE